MGAPFPAVAGRGEKNEPLPPFPFSPSFDGEKVPRGADEGPLHIRRREAPHPPFEKSELRPPPDKHLTASRDPVMSRD